MAAPEQPDWSAVRRLNPFLGVAEVVDIGVARALSADGVTWQIQVRTERPTRSWGSLGLATRARRYYRFGCWSQADGLARSPVHPELDVNLMLTAWQQLSAVLPNCLSRLPFPLADRYERWLLDHERRPLALLARVVEGRRFGQTVPLQWRVAMPVERGFDVATGKHQGSPDVGSRPPHWGRELLEKWEAHASGSCGAATAVAAQWSRPRGVL